MILSIFKSESPDHVKSIVAGHNDGSLGMLEAGPLNVQSNTALLQRPVLLSVPRKNISVSHSRVVEVPMRSPRLDGYRYFLRFSARLPDR